MKKPPVCTMHIQSQHQNNESHKNDFQDRVSILKVHCRNKKVDPSVDLEYLAKACVGMSGAQLATLVNTAGLRAVHKNKERIDQVLSLIFWGVFISL